MPIIKDLTSQGKTQEQIAEELGLANKKVVWNLLYRERQKEIQGVPRFRGRKPAKTLQEYKYENKRLKMENELLRDFLSLTDSYSIYNQSSQEKGKDHRGVAVPQ